MEINPGFVTNLAQVDISRVAHQVHSMNELWGLPLQIGLVLFYLYTQVHSAFFYAIYAVAIMILIDIIIVIFITAKLCLVNMIQDAAMAVGHMNVDVVTDALKRSTDRIMGPKYMMAGLGDGGGPGDGGTDGGMAANNSGSGGAIKSY